MKLDKLLSKVLFSVNDYAISGYDLLGVALIIILCFVAIKIVKRIFKRQINKGRIDSGRGLAIYQIFKYIIIVVTIILALDTIGVKVTILLAGSAALLVGVGLGLQQLFNDLVSGLFLLFEGTVTVGDIVEIDGLVGRVKEINIRTSNIESRGGISIIVPNSKLVNDNVINWSHNRTVTRFDLTVGVAYGSDVRLVERLLIQAAEQHKEIVTEPKPLVRFEDFGDSALVFHLFFWSLNMFEIENIKSDIRFSIDELFRQNNVTIPFPQRDLHFKSTDISINKSL